MNTAVANKQELLEILFLHRERIRRYGVKFLGLFGSFQRNEKIHKKSDVDFIVEYHAGQRTFRNLMDLGYFLEDLLGRKVELIHPTALSAYSGPRILNSIEYVPLGPDPSPAHVGSHQEDTIDHGW